MSNCGSPQKRDRFLAYLSKIAPVTLETEIQCPAYAWFRSAEDNDTVPHHWLRGFEVYETPEANTVTHRASAPYKAFRAAVREESLLERPSDLSFWRPTGVGFLGRPGTINLMKEEGTGPGLQYAVVHELVPAAGMKGQALAELRKVADLAENSPSAASFWVLHRGDGDKDGSLYVFGLFTTRMVAEKFETGESRGVWERLEDMCESTRRTTWVECGIGFIGRPA
ncbi:uncharacterized protein DNG_09475 [Cephalotrichum gorgonifer]|uniref:ABM domain-containing protein n=1 Tax=Cephalotrichum gorgonifer TaxID=2041049 RepID=A0AAE8SZC3_9PEZI|nr:uncharacterized protein DNG_09475 [Cephalotrichum gorgonifer]